MTNPHKEPLAVAPFLEWCDKRETQIRRDLDNLPGLRSFKLNDDAGSRLVMELGWDVESGQRRLRRWRHETLSGLIGREVIEEALFCAGVPFEEIYPDEPTPPRVAVRLGQGSRMTQPQLVAAHTVYMRANMTMNDVAALIWQRYGYANPEAARHALTRGWRSLGLQVRRQCTQITADGERCDKAPLSGQEHCFKHDKKTQTWQMPRELTERARALHVEEGLTLNAIGALLVDETPWQTWKYAARRIAIIAHEQGWHRQLAGGRPFHRTALREAA
jgi:hypothetical protein